MSAGSGEGKFAWFCITLELGPLTLVASPGFCFGTTAEVTTCGMESYVKVAKNKNVDLRGKLVSEASDRHCCFLQAGKGAQSGHRVTVTPSKVGSAHAL